MFGPSNFNAIEVLGDIIKPPGSCASLHHESADSKLILPLLEKLLLTWLFFISLLVVKQACRDSDATMR